MLNYIWSAMILISVAVSFVNGKTSEVCTALCDGASEGVSLAIGIAGIMAFWTGMMKVAERAGLTRIVAKVFAPLISLIISEAKEDKEISGAVAMNMTANFFGMGNASTPLGINAMKKLSAHSKKGVASSSMCMLAVINCASVQLVPSTLIAIRSAMGSANAGEIMVPIWIVSVVTFLSGVILCKVLGARG